jgi:hypothetical protein
VLLQTDDGHTEPLSVEMRNGRVCWVTERKPIGFYVSKIPKNANKWTEWCENVLTHFRPTLWQAGILDAVNETRSAFGVSKKMYMACLELFDIHSNTVRFQLSHRRDSSVLSSNRSASLLARSFTLASLNEPDLLFTILVKVKARRVSSLKDSPAGRPKVSLLWFVADHLPR